MLASSDQENYALNDDSSSESLLSDRRPSMESHGITVEEAYELCGGFGRFQKFVAFSVVLALSTSQAFLYAFVFLELLQDFECLEGLTWVSCSTGDFCDNSSVVWQVDWSSEFSLHNLIEQLNFYCATDFQIGMMGSCFLIGIAIGCVTLARLADVYGRKAIFLFSMVLFLTSLLSFLWIQNYIVAYIMTVVVGWAGWGKQVSGYTHMMEMNPKSSQVLVSTMEFFMEGVIFFYACAYFYWITTFWQYILIVPCVCGTIGTILVAFMPENPRFLIAKKRFDEARKAFSWISKKNGKEEEARAELFLFHEEVQAMRAGIVFENDKQSALQSLKELWMVPEYRKNLIFSVVLWSANMFNFYMLTFYVKYFPGNIYQNTICFACSDIIAYVISGFIMKCFNTNRSLYFCYLFSTSGGILYLIFEGNHAQLIPVFIVLCRIGTNMAFSVTYCANTRLFPTKFLATSFGIENLVAHIIAVIGPVIAELDEPIPFIAYLVAIGTGLISTYFLKELEPEAKPRKDESEKDGSTDETSTPGTTDTQDSPKPQD